MVGMAGSVTGLVVVVTGNVPSVLNTLTTKSLREPEVAVVPLKIALVAPLIA